jgi:hypothetical protein
LYQNQLLAQTGGFYKYKALCTRQTPYFVPVGATSFNFQIQSTVIPEILALMFIRTEQLDPATRDTTIHPLCTSNSGGVAPLISIRDMHINYAGKRYPENGNITREAGGNWGGTANIDYQVYCDIVGMTNPEIDGPQPLLSQAFMDSNQVQVYFYPLIDAFQCVDRKNPNVQRGSISVVANFNSATTIATTVFMAEISNQHVAVNPVANRIFKSW